MDTLRVVVGVGLPWLLGVVWLRYRWPRAPEGGWALVLGYGFFIGILVTTLLMRVVDELGLSLSFWLIGTMLAVLTGTGLTRKTLAGMERKRSVGEPFDHGVRRADLRIAAAVRVHRARAGARPLDAWDA
jgi:hypothetical protein